MIDALTEHFSDVPLDERFVPSRNSPFCFELTHTHRGTVRVLVPGAGLGRLSYDIAKLGRPKPFSLLPSDAPPNQAFPVKEMNSPSSCSSRPLSFSTGSLHGSHSTLNLRLLTKR